MVAPERKARLGHTAVEYRPTTSILTQPSGFIDAFDYTLNPYAGCSFGCTDCYAPFFARTDEAQGELGPVGAGQGERAGFTGQKAAETVDR